MQILLKMTISSKLRFMSSSSEDAVDIERKLDWPPDMRMPVKDDVIEIETFTRAVEEVHLHPLGIGPFATVYLEDFIDPDPDESADIDFSDWSRGMFRT